MLVKLLDFGIAKLIAPRRGDDRVARDADQDRPGRRDAELHVARAGARQARRPSHRHLRARRHRLRDVPRAAAVRGRQRRRHLVRMHLSEPPPSPKSLWPEIPPPLDALLLRMLEKSAAERPSPAQVRDADSRAARHAAAVRLGHVPASSPRSHRGGRRRARGGALDAGRGAAAVAARAPRALWFGARARALRLRRGALRRPALASSASVRIRRRRRRHRRRRRRAPKTAPPAPATAPVVREGTVVVRVDATDARIELDGAAGRAVGLGGAARRRRRGSTRWRERAADAVSYAGGSTSPAGGTVELAVHLHHDSAEPAAPPPSRRRRRRAAPKKAHDKRNRSRLPRGPVRDGSQMRAAVVAVALLLGAATAHRRPGPPRRSPRRASTTDRGMAHYELGEFAAAIDEFKLAYALSQAPGLLFNLAQASRLNKDYEQALHFYSYVLARAARRAQSRRRRGAHRRARAGGRSCSRRRPSTSSPPTPQPPPPVAGSPVDTPADAGARAAERRSERVAGIVVAAVGVARSSAPASGSASPSLDAQNKLSSLGHAHRQLGRRRQASLYQSGQREARRLDGALRRRRRRRRHRRRALRLGWQRDRARFAVAPATGGGAQAMWSCAF